MSLVGQLVLVKWFDAWFDFELNEDAFRSDYPVETVGYLVRHGDVVSVAGEKLPDGWRAITHIPGSLVESINALHNGSLKLLHGSPFQKSPLHDGSLTEP